MISGESVVGGDALRSRWSIHQGRSTHVGWSPVLYMAGGHAHQYNEPSVILIWRTSMVKQCPGFMTPGSSFSGEKVSVLKCRVHNVRNSAHNTHCRVISMAGGGKPCQSHAL